MTERVLIAGLLLGTFAACVPSESIRCPDQTEEVTGSCLVACSVDEECLIGEVCDPGEGACVLGQGMRPSIVELRAEESPVARGRPVHLFFSVQDATRVSIDHSVLANSTKIVGDVWTQPIDESTTFELLAFGPGGRTRRAISIDVSDRPIAPTIIRFAASNEAPRPGELVNLSWDVAGATRIRIMSGENQIHSTSDAHGSVAYFPSAGESLLELWASNGAGDTRSDLTINVQVSGPEIQLFEASKTTAIVGDSVQLSWRTSGAINMEILSDGSSQLFRSEDRTLVALGAHMVQMPSPMPGATMVKFTLVITGDDGSKASSDVMVNIEHGT